MTEIGKISSNISRQGEKQKAYVNDDEFGSANLEFVSCPKNPYSAVQIRRIELKALFVKFAMSSISDATVVVRPACGSAARGGERNVVDGEVKVGWKRGMIRPMPSRENGAPANAFTGD